MTSLAMLLCFGLLFVPSLLWLHCCGRHGFGRHSPPCGRHGLILGPLSFVAVIAVAVMVCGRYRRFLEWISLKIFSLKYSPP